MTKILPLATSHIAHFCYRFRYVFAGLISMPSFKSIDFYQNRLKIKLFLKKNNAKFSSAWVSAYHTPETAPQLHISGYALGFMMYFTLWPPVFHRFNVFE